MPTTSAPFIGIDFGTSKSVMARYDAATKHAEIINNREGHRETPSVIYFGKSDSDIVVGEQAETLLDAAHIDQNRFALSVKRDLLSAAPKVLDDGRIYWPVDIAAKILGKLKDDAERLVFQENPVKRAVITYPASFDPPRHDKIKQAAEKAGFEEVRLLQEPVAAAIAYSRSGLRVGKYILVYDFGGGTFDVAVIASDSQTTDHPFELVAPPCGLPNCGGDDLDRRLYEYCDEIALQQLHRHISLTNDIDLQFLHSCRKRKENLSINATAIFSNYLLSSGNAVVFEHTLQRATFEERIRDYIDRTVTETQRAIRDANSHQCQVDTVVLIGGSSRIPLVMHALKSSLPVQPQEWDHHNLAVALGAAYYAQYLWGSFDRPRSPLDQYRDAVQDRWAPARTLTQAQIGELANLANRLGISPNLAADTERQVMGETKEENLRREGRHNAALEQYRRVVSEVWNGKNLTRPEADYLDRQAKITNLSIEDIKMVERYVMGHTKESLSSRYEESLAEYYRAVAGIWKGNWLTRDEFNYLAEQERMNGLREEDAAGIERSIMVGRTKIELINNPPPSDGPVPPPPPRRLGRKSWPIGLLLIGLITMISNINNADRYVFGVLLMIVGIVWLIASFAGKPREHVPPSYPSH